MEKKVCLEGAKGEANCKSGNINRSRLSSSFPRKEKLDAREGSARSAEERSGSDVCWLASAHRRVGIRVVGVQAFAVCRGGVLFLAQFLTISYCERIALDLSAISSRLVTLDTSSSSSKKIRLRASLPVFLSGTRAPDHLAGGHPPSKSE